MWYIGYQEAIRAEIKEERDKELPDLEASGAWAGEWEEKGVVRGKTGSGLVLCSFLPSTV